MAATNTTAVEDKLFDFMSRFGLPHTIVTDNGTAFTSHQFKKFCTKNNIKHLTSPAYHPASNGQAESYVKIVKRGIKSSLLSTNNIRQGKLQLLKYLFDYRNSVHSVTGVSPAELVYGTKLRSRLDLICPTSSSNSSTSLGNNVYAKQCSQSKYYGGVNKQYFSSGDNVLYKKYYNNNKFIWCRGIVIRRIGKVLYILKDSLSSLEIKKHKNQIVLYKGNNSVTECPNYSGISSNDSPEYMSNSESTPAIQELNETSDEGEERLQEQTLPVDQEIASRNSTRLLRNIPRVDYKPFF